MPPLASVLTLLPAVPLVWSHAWKVSALDEVPLYPPVGAKYSRVSAFASSSSDEPPVTAPTVVQFVPPSVV